MCTRKKLYNLEKNQICNIKLLKKIHEYFNENYEPCDASACKFKNCNNLDFYSDLVKVQIEYYTLQEFFFTSHHYYFVINDSIELHAGLDQRVTPRYYYSKTRNNVYTGETYYLCTKCFDEAFMDFFTNHCTNFNLSTNNCDVITGRGRSTIFLSISIFLLLINIVFTNLTNIFLLLFSLPACIFMINVLIYQNEYQCIHLYLNREKVNEEH